MQTDKPVGLTASQTDAEFPQNGPYRDRISEKIHIFLVFEENQIVVLALQILTIQRKSALFGLRLVQYTNFQ